MTQVQQPARVEGPVVELVHGDLFDSNARLLVAPCDVAGGMTREVLRQVKRLGATGPSGSFAPGQVVAQTTDSGRVILFAMVVDRVTEAQTVQNVRVAANHIGTLAGADVVAVPLLGTGAGGLLPEQSVRALIDGFLETAGVGATLLIYSREQGLIDTLRQRFPEGGEYRTGTNVEGHPDAESSDHPWNDALTEGFSPGEQVAAGAVVAYLLASLTDGAGGLVDREALTATGSRMTVEDHLRAVRQRWSSQTIAKLEAVHLVLGLAMDRDVGWPLLRSGTVDSLVVGWSEGLPWDDLSPAGRELAENQPLLAAALGAPAEWAAELPAAVTRLAFSPTGDRVAALADGVVYEAAADGSIRRVGTVDGTVASLGWGRDGILALRVVGSAAEVAQVGTGTVLGRVKDVVDGVLGNGLPAWLVRPNGVVRWWGPDQPADELSPAGSSMLAVDGSGRRGIVATDDEAVVLSTLTEDRTAADAATPTAVAVPVARIAWPEGPYALLTLGSALAIAEVTDDDQLVIGEPGRPPIARVVTGGLPIDVLAADLSGRSLAMGSGDQVRVWPVAQSRPVSHGIAGYIADDVAGADLLDADRDALALASLVASEQLRPPLAVGLFGEWGSGKTFILDRIVTILEDLAASKNNGYVDDVAVVRFNAWHYAETNLWASLVDQVLRKVVEPAPQTIPEIEEAATRASQAEEVVERVGAELTEADRQIEEATRAVVRQRRIAWATGGVAILLLAAAATTMVMAGSGPVVAAVSGALAVFGSLAAAAAAVSNLRGEAAGMVQAARAGIADFGRFTGRTAAAAARATVQRRQELLDQQRKARDEAERLRGEADRLSRRAESDRIAEVLGRLSTVTEYREQLSLVTRTRDRFDEISRTFGRSRRVVIAIDDLDRCAAEKVVRVLEAVNLLFNFEMFVVLLAVDTRWLDQSLRIRYHQLLGEAGGAAPSDYLEKIIQIPMRLVPLDEGLVRKMITGLTGRTTSGANGSGPEDRSPTPPPPDPEPAPPEDEPDAGGIDPETAPAQDRLDANGADPVLHPDGRSDTARTTTARSPRASRQHLPPEVLEITDSEAAAMSAVAPLIGTTPRTVKRFVNTYRLLKARVPDPTEFDASRGGIGDHEVVAFLLSVTTGEPAAISPLLTYLRTAAANVTLGAAVDGSDPALARVRGWLAQHRRYASAPCHRFADWAPEIARFSFVSQTDGG